MQKSYPDFELVSLQLNRLDSLTCHTAAAVSWVLHMRAM